MENKNYKVNESFIGIGARTSGNLTRKVLGGEMNNDSNNLKESRIVIYDVNCDDIIPRSINQYTQANIRKLAKSIKITNERLINPITLVRPEDLDENSPILEKYRERGIDYKDKLIIVAGERRYRAWQMLREEEAKRLIEEKQFKKNKFDTIPANILTHQEARNEENYYKDSNNLARQLTPVEGLNQIKDIIADTDTVNGKRKALEAQYEKDYSQFTDDEINKKFSQAQYIQYVLENELGITGWSASTIRTYLAVVNQSIPEVLDAVFATKMSAGEARRLCKLPQETQKSLMQIYIEDQKKYYSAMDEILAKKEHAKKRIDYKTSVKEMSSLQDKINQSINEMNVILKELPKSDAHITKEYIKQCSKFIEKIEEIKNKF